MSELPHQEFLFTIAEVAATFVGFSLIGSILRTTEGDFRFLMMRDVAQVSLTTVFGAFLPYLLLQFGLQGEALWRASSGGLLMCWIAGGAFAYRRTSKQGLAVPAWRVAPGLVTFGWLGNAIGPGLLLWAAFAGSSLLGTLYLLALSILLALAGLMFIWATFMRASHPTAV